MFSYALKRVARSMGLFTALLLGIVLASTFFSGINIGADTTAKAALNQQLERVLVDISVGAWYGTVLSSANWTAASERAIQVSNVEGVEIISRFNTFGERESNYTFSRIVGILGDSRVHDGLNVTSGASSLGENETYVWIGSEDVDEIQTNDTLTFNFTLQSYPQPEVTFSMQLKVAGFVELDETAYSLALGAYTSGNGLEPIIQDFKPEYYGNLLLVSWEKTFSQFLDSVYQLGPQYSPIQTEILLFLDRDKVINQWDIGASQESIQRVVNQIENQVAEFGLRASSNLNQALSSYLILSLGMRLSFIVVALPVFFVAWYVGTTVSDVSFNLRRREIGLLLARGCSSGQLLRLFLSESLLIGISGGLIGVGLSFLLSPYFVAAIGPEFGGTSPILTLDIIALTIVFSAAITLLSTFRPSRRAARLPAVDALKEYMYIEEAKPYRQKWPLLALGLGAYKICMFLLGVPSLAQYFTARPPPTSNILLMILLGAWIVVDSILVPLAPLLFFWGITKILIRGSLGFQTLATKVAKLFGDLGTLATKNLRRNPARAAAVAFLIALITGYGFQTVGTLASEEDYVVRQIKASVGADISVTLANLSNATALKTEIEDLSGAASTTLEYSFAGETSYQSLSLTAIDPNEWLSTAYYEDEWFTGDHATSAFNQMLLDNYTIILGRTVATGLDLAIGDTITLTIGVTNMKLRVVGYFGPATTGGSQPVFRPEEYVVVSRFWSYVPAGLYLSLNQTTYTSGEILVKLESGANGTDLAAQIRDFESNDIAFVSSVEEQLQEREGNLLLTGVSNIQRIGVVFSVVAASVATALVTIVGLQERRKEVTIMNVRGISFSQLLSVLLAEALAVVIFSLVLGIVVGLIIVNGSISALNTTQYAPLVAHRMVFPPDAILTLSISLILIFLSSTLPVIAITRRYISKLVRIVRA